VLTLAEPESSVALVQTPFILLSLATNPEIGSDVEDFVSLTCVAIAYLSFPNLQSELVSSGGFPVFLSACTAMFTQFDPALTEDPDLALQLKQARAACISILSDMSAIASFQFIYPLGTPAIQTLQSWLHSPHVQLQSAACLALGNVARSDEASVALVSNYKVHLPLVAIVSNPQATDSQLLHSVLSFLKNLAIPPQNKPILGDAGLLSPLALPRIWSLDTIPQVQFAAVSLTRLLVISCPPNARRVCAPLSPDPTSPAHNRTNVHRLIDLFERSDAEPTKMEAARAVANICRVLHSTPVLPVLLDWEAAEGYVFRQPAPPAPPAPAKGSPLSQVSTPSSDGTGGGGRRERFYKEHVLINKPLSYLLTQSRFPVLRSETLFVFALMCRTRDGALVVIRVLQILEAFGALVSAVTGKSHFEPGADIVANSQSHQMSSSTMNTPMVADPSMIEELGLEPRQVDPQHAASMARVDRENGLVLVSELVRNWGDDLPPFRKEYLREMLREGGELIAEDRNKGKGRAT
jgi:hypothetical protein